MAVDFRTCPVCLRPRLKARPGYGDLVDGCLSCGRAFIAGRATEIDGVEGPRAWVERGVVVPPFRPALPAAAAAPTAHEEAA